jgi:hypothetical protein
MIGLLQSGTGIGRGMCLPITSSGLLAPRAAAGREPDTGALREDSTRAATGVAASERLPTYSRREPVGASWRTRERGCSPVLPADASWMAAVACGGSVAEEPDAGATELPESLPVEVGGTPGGVAMPPPPGVEAPPGGVETPPPGGDTPGGVETPPGGPAGGLPATGGAGSVGVLGTDTVALGTDTVTLGTDTLTPGTDTLPPVVDTLAPGTDTPTSGVDTLTPGTGTPISATLTAIAAPLDLRATILSHNARLRSE